MKNPYILPAFTGVLFGCWPLLMNRSGLSGNLSAAVFTLLAFVLLLPFAIYDGMQTAYTAKWWYAIAASICAAAGLLLFSAMLAKTTPQEVGLQFITMMLVQIAVLAVYYVLLTRDFAPRRLLGFALAGVVVYLLR